MSAKYKVQSIIRGKSFTFDAGSEVEANRIKQMLQHANEDLESFMPGFGLKQKPHRVKIFKVDE